MFGISYGELFLLIGATAALVGISSLSLIMLTYIYWFVGLIGIMGNTFIVVKRKAFLSQKLKWV